MSNNQRNVSYVKRKYLEDVTNIHETQQRAYKTEYPDISVQAMKSSCIDANESNDYHLFRNYQNVHPLLGWYKADLDTGVLSYDQFRALLETENEPQLIELLVTTGLIAEHRPCIYCGGMMRKKKDGKHMFWICTRSVNGIKCNRGKKSIRDGTIFDNSNLSTQTILTIIWHFVHHLNEKQCAEYTNISQKNNTTIIKWYKFCRDVCTEWFWDARNTPKLGGYGKIIEIDESYFPGVPKFNRGRRLGGDAWEDDEKWVFAMTERDSLDAIAIQVPSNRSRKNLLPHINDHCLPGSIFCSDGWKAYYKLAEHLVVDDALHYAVNHSENFVDPETGAHTQTVEGFWRQCKSYLPNFGLKPRYLRTYIGSFLWYRYCKQRKLDLFVHMLKSISEKRPFVTQLLPVAELTFNPVFKEGTKENAIEILDNDKADEDFMYP